MAITKHVFSLFWVYVGTVQILFKYRGCCDIHKRLVLPAGSVIASLNNLTLSASCGPAKEKDQSSGCRGVLSNIPVSFFKALFVPAAFLYLFSV